MSANVGHCLRVHLSFWIFEHERLEHLQAKVSEPAQEICMQCDPGNLERNGEDGICKAGPSRECWTKPAIKRAIIIIIDALRYMSSNLSCGCWIRVGFLIRHCSLQIVIL